MFKKYVEIRIFFAFKIPQICLFNIPKSIAMILFLVTVIFLMTIFIIYLIIDFYRDKKKYTSRIKALEDVIFQISNKQIIQSNQLKLSDDLNENLKKSKSTLSTDIFNLNYDLFEILAKNDLLKK